MSITVTLWPWTTHSVMLSIVRSPAAAWSGNHHGPLPAGREMPGVHLSEDMPCQTGKDSCTPLSNLTNLDLSV